MDELISWSHTVNVGFLFAPLTCMGASKSMAVRVFQSSIKSGALNRILDDAFVLSRPYAPRTTQHL